MTRTPEADSHDPGGAPSGDAPLEETLATCWARLLALPRFPNGDGRQRLQRLLAPLADRPAGRDAIKITGSNGKGSTAAMTAAILRAAGVSTGLFTSPHLRAPNERFVIDGAPIEPAAFVRSAQWVLGRIEADGPERSERHDPKEHVGIFEALTALAIHAFDEAGVDAWILEAGIGGRLDPTGAIPGQLSAIVSVDLEHTELLGATEAAIARDKADLADDRSTLLLGDLGPALREEVRRHVGARGVTVHGARGGCTVRDVRQRDSRTWVDFTMGDRQLDDVHLGFDGAHQAHNAALAGALAARWLARHRPTLTVDQVDAAIRHGLAEDSLAGRFERVHQDPAVWVDVAHTPAATRALATVVRARQEERPLLLVTGVAAGRDSRALLAPLAPLASHIIVTRAHHRGGDPAPVARALAQLTSEARPQPPLDTLAPLHTAIEMAMVAARREGMYILVAGGFFLAAETIAILEGRDPRACAFF